MQRLWIRRREEFLQDRLIESNDCISAFLKDKAKGVVTPAIAEDSPLPMMHEELVHVSVIIQQQRYLSPNQRYDGLEKDD